jgi:hypothetical protein
MKHLFHETSLSLSFIYRFGRGGGLDWFIIKQAPGIQQNPIFAATPPPPYLAALSIFFTFPT